MPLYDDIIRRPAEPSARTPSDTQPADADESGAPAETDEIDLERALWDMEYRRGVLEILRQTRRNDTEPPATPTPADPNHGKKGP